MECSQTLSAEAKPYVPLATCVGPPPVAKLPSPGFFTKPVPYPYLAPPPQTGFLSGFPGCWGIPLGPGGVGIQGAFPPPAWAPPMPPPHGAIATPAGTPCTMAKAASQGGGKLPSRSVRTGRVPGARPPPPRLDVPPRLPRPAAARPGAPTASRGARTAATGGHGAAKEDPAARGAKAPAAGEEAAANEPSPRSVLVATSPPISPTTSLPSSYPLPCLPPATAALAPPTEAPPHNAEHGACSMPAGSPKMRRRRGPRRAQPAPGGDVRRGVRKPRLLFDLASNRTTLMIRHLPNDFTKMRLMAIIDEHCFMENEKIAPGGVKSEYDFLYVPIDFRTMANKGYAFVNMTSPDAARRLWEHLHGHRWEVRRCGKTCAVDYGAVQGLVRLVDHFSLSSFECDSEDLLPVRFEPPRDGTRSAQGMAHVVGGLRRRS
ncbi:hypothetical protein C2845_PM03G04200 [Panicum miliaceum]|uniref:Mei2-like C-terminal RNA recognition motif domain-containing protein n=1 Tax=Panicum miliaceum TaxID=4540 RepID=A0A3L6TDX7_PANMI|nr:hypothetical protein C2845_PM03G04200 [Panicum miliaceum]